MSKFMNLDPVLEAKLGHAKELAQAGNSEGSKKLLVELYESDNPRYSVPATFNLGWHEIKAGNLLKGFTMLFAGREIGAYGLPQLDTPKPLWMGEPLKGKRILLRGEGGYGDMLINLRFAQNLKELGAYVTFSCPKEMCSYLRRVDYIDALIDNEYAAGADFDYWLPAMSAVQALKIEYEQLSGKPYLPRPRAVPLSGDFKVGIRWAGSPKFEEELLRKLPSDKLCDLANVEGATVYSLQHGCDLIELPDNVLDLEPLMRDWTATASLISGLDLVVTSCTSVAHLSAGMGIETWLLAPILPYYLWTLPGDKSPWYDTITLYRQEEAGNWNAPLARVKEDLRKRLEK